MRLGSGVIFFGEDWLYEKSNECIFDKTIRKYPMVDQGLFYLDSKKFSKGIRPDAVLYDERDCNPYSQPFNLTESFK